MTDIPILFQPNMVDALLTNRKFKTRRILKVQPKVTIIGTNEWLTYPLKEILNYRIKKGDRLWVKEQHYAIGYWRTTDSFTKTGKPKRIFVRDTDEPVAFDGIHDVLSNSLERRYGWYKRNSLFHCKADSRITLTVTDVRIQRLQDISEADAIAEGAMEYDGGYCFGVGGLFWAATAKKSFEYLINSINGPDTWERNDWVGAISFEVHKGNVDQLRTNP
ncbi:MAG: hypothetical protein COA47_05910 [Robiginitomaculum sp.]|nr:MAG: hypothetical protein COA47_05910 [Robiginitomaculum sp.]